MTEARKRVLEIIDGMQNEIVEAISALVQIPSVNPKYPGQDYDAVVGGETRANQELSRHYEDLGAEVEFLEVEANRANLIGVWKGEGGGKSLAYNGHIDVVPFGQASNWRFGDPFSGKIEDGRIWGRGSTDMKSGLVSQVKAAQAIQRAGLRLKGDLILQSVVGEEVMDHLAGATAVARRYPADGAIVSEPTAPPTPLAIAPVTSAVWHVSITCSGKSVHASVRDEVIRAGGRGSEIGVNAIEKGIFIVNNLRLLEEQWGQTKTHPLFRPGHFTIHPGLIMGAPHGTPVPFLLSEYCTVEYMVWYSPDDDPAGVQKEVEDYIHAIIQLDPWLKEHPPEIEWKSNWQASVVDVDHPITQAMVAAHVEAVQGHDRLSPDPTIHGFAAVCDATFLNNEGTPAISYGPGNLLVAHAENEFVEIDEVMVATRAFALLAMDWCGVVE